VTFVIALLLAWALDLRFGEPRSAWHPVAWLGSLLAPFGRALSQASGVGAFLGGALVWLVFAGAIAWATWAAQAQLLALSPWFAAPLLALLLKPSFSWRMLRDEVADVDTALAHSLEAGRARLARIVSRDVNTLDAEAVRETAIESLAENLNDALVAPLFWYALAGLPGAAVYRFANTLDAMWGYRGRWEWAGKWSAIADDVLSWLPARLTAVLLRPPLRPSDWRLLRAEARHTPSPNGGWPMGAMALRLGVRLRKPGVYVLNERAPSPGAVHVARALRLATRAAWVCVAVVMLAIGVKAAWP
jgi:adenosylcobinamide-phosphate synthase